MNILLKIFGIVILTLLFSIPSWIYLDRKTFKKLIHRKKLLDKVEPFYDSYNFDTTYEEVLKNTNLNNVKKEHKQNFIHSLAPLFMCISIYLPMSCIFFIKDNDIMNFLGFIEIVGFCICFKILKRRKFPKYKETIVKNLLEFIEPKLKYHTNYSYYDIEKNLYKSSNFDTENDAVDLAIITDYIEYMLSSNTLVQLINIRISSKHSRENIFEGISIKTPLVQNYSDDILIIINENTRNVRNDTLLEKLLSIYEKYKISFDISINNQNLYIRFLTGPLFESTYAFSFDKNKERLYGDYILLQSVLDITTKVSKLFNNQQ